MIPLMSIIKNRGAKRSLEVRRSKTGLGLFTKEGIESNGFIAEYTGAVLTRKEADRKGGKYLFETSYNRFVDGSDRQNMARYINHSCKPNCEIEVVRGRILVVAKRHIKPGEELNYDYDEEYFNEFIKPFGCKCQACSSKKTKA
jgi:uncharacterized protein